MFFVGHCGAFHSVGDQYRLRKHPYSGYTHGVTNIQSNYVPRKGQRRGTQVIDAFDTNWLVRDSAPSGFKIEHQDGGWAFGVSYGQQTAVRLKDRHGNVVAQEGCDRCSCGCKYWENDRCIDCGTPIADVLAANRGQRESDTF